MPKNLPAPRFRTVFLRWFIALLVFFFLANAAGVVRPEEVKAFRWTGFPFPFAAWGFGVKEEFDSNALMLDVVIALGASILLALLCALSRVRFRKKEPT